MSVNFSNSGTLEIYGRLPLVNSSGIFSIYDNETATQKVATSFSISGNKGTIDYTIDNMHTSKDSYFINLGAEDYIGECRDCSGLSPTVEVLDEDFLEPYYPPSGIQIIYQDFEGGMASGMTLSGYGSGILTSGIEANSELQGSYNVGITAFANSSVYIIPTAPEASGLLKGRTIFLMNLGFDSGTNDQVVGFSFLRQGASLDSNGYKIYLRSTPANSTRFDISFDYGQVGHATTGVVNGIGNNIFRVPVEFYSLDVKRAYRKQWIIIEWEVSTSPVSLLKLSIYHKLFSSEDTYHSIRSNAKLIRQHLFCGDKNGTGLYTSTTQPVAWFVCTDGGSTTRIDSIYLESIDKVTDKGIFNTELSVLDYTTSGEPRLEAYNTVLNLGTQTGPLGSTYDDTDINPLISSARSIYGKARYGHSGPVFRKYSDFSANRAFTSYYFTNPLANGIKHGVFRAALRVGAEANNKLGFSFLLQSLSVFDNAYTVLYYRNGANDFRLRLKKGIILTGVGGSEDFSGTTLATSSSLSNVLDTSLIWMEVRWKAGINTDIEVFYAVLRSGIGDLYIDTSPGNLDSRLISVLSVTDSASPYLTTSVSPVITSISRNSNQFLLNCRWLKWELRRAKIGNS